MELSKRLTAVASLADSGNTIADIGCDHGYVGIWLIQQNIFLRVIAMDVRSGPLDAARKNIQFFQMEDCIELRQSDGLAGLVQGEADGMICAGMGGALICRILKNHLEKAQAMDQIILQPQSEIFLVRRFLRQNGFVIQKENMVKEDGKYYPMFQTVWHGEKMSGERRKLILKGVSEELQEVYDDYGELLLKNRHPVLREWLLKEQRTTEHICSELQKSKNNGCSMKKIERQENRLLEMREKQKKILKALEFYKDYLI